MTRGGSDTRQLGRPNFSEPLLVIRENRFAHAALSRLSDPGGGGLARLVFLYGPAGIGKSHLIRQHIRDRQRRDGRLRTTCVTGSEFAAELAAASQSNTIDVFQNRYRSRDLVIFEDIGLLQNRLETQRQLTPILDAILDSGGQVLLSADRLPGDIEHLSPRIVSRCHAGICAPIAMPGYDSRVSLLRHFSATRQVPLPDDVIRLLAERLPVSPRELLAGILQLDANARLHACSIGTRLAGRFVDNEVQRRSVTLPEIARTVSRHFGIPVAHVRASAQQHGQALPRQVAMWLAREMTSVPLRTIAEYFGRRNHATVLHACGRINDMLNTHASLRRQVAHIRKNLEQF